MDAPRVGATRSWTPPASCSSRTRARRLGRSPTRASGPSTTKSRGMDGTCGSSSCRSPSATAWSSSRSAASAL